MKTDTPRPGALTLADLVVRWGFARQTVAALCRSGRLPATMVDGKWCLALSDVEAYEQGRSIRLGPVCSCGLRPRLDSDTRHCRACHADKPVESFFVDPRAEDGRRSRCKACFGGAARAYKTANAEHLSNARRSYRAANPEKTRRHSMSWREKHPEWWAILHRTREAVARALKKGVLVRPATCSECGESGPIEAAHRDYGKPLDVRWLCRPCHRRWDRVEPKLSNREVA